MLDEITINNLAKSSEQHAFSALEIAKTYQIDNQEMAEMAADELVSIKSKQKELDEQRKAFTRPLDEKKKEIMALFEPAVTLLKDAETVLKGAINAWGEAERNRLAIERKAQQEILLRQQMEAEQAAQKARDEAAAASKAGDEAKAGELILAASAKESEAEAVQYAALARVEPAKLSGISERMDWDFEVIDPASIPREYLVVDESKIRRVVKALGAASNIAGVRVFQKPVVSVRARR
jgi:hypothetical protein